MRAHTKTPWVIEQCERNGHPLSSWAVIGVDTDGTEALVATFETLEDATLCAAAPRLLRSLTTMVAWHDAVRREFRGATALVPSPFGIEKARDALCAARGETAKP